MIDVEVSGVHREFWMDIKVEYFDIANAMNYELPNTLSPS